MPDKDVRYYRRLPYRRTVAPRRDSDGRVYFLAQLEEIPSIRIHGESREEALHKLDEVFDDLIESMLEEGAEIPEPQLWPAPFLSSSRPRAPHRYRQPQRYVVKYVDAAMEHERPIIAPEGGQIPDFGSVDSDSLTAGAA
jgi:predicted RNase H-like HicB family nuclease